MGFDQRALVVVGVGPGGEPGVEGEGIDGLWHAGEQGRPHDGIAAPRAVVGGTGGVDEAEGGGAVREGAVDEGAFLIFSGGCCDEGDGAWYANAV